MRHQALGYGCQLLVLDHLTMVTSDGASQDERREIDLIMTQLTSLANETNVSILVASQLAKPGGSGPSYEEGRPISLGSFRGSGSITSQAWDVLGLERNLQAEGAQRNRMGVRVLKCRGEGETGMADTLSYDRTSGRLTALEEAPEEDLEQEAAEAGLEAFE